MVPPTLVDSGASSIFVSKQLDLLHNTLNRPLKLQLFNGSPASTGITQYHNSALILNNDLEFQVWILITQLLESTLIVLGLPWLQDVNSDIDWRNLTIPPQTPMSSTPTPAALEELKAPQPSRTTKKERKMHLHSSPPSTHSDSFSTTFSESI
ncbi:hypothetical protein C0989_000281 [Termitomyces sp. Mn162]|nr:hypothetical protein C0989_000281 [Termitomyces sp. Mn162]